MEVGLWCLLPYSYYTTCLGADFYDSFNTRYTGFELSSTVATTSNNGSLWNSIKGNVKGIGDYFWIKLNNTNVRCRIAGRNIYKGCGDSALTTNHYAIVTDTAFQNAAYYPTDNVAGTSKSSGNTSTKQAFLGSDIWNLTLGANPSTGNAVTTSGINATLYSIFGSTLLKYRDQSTNAVDTTVPPSGNPIWNTASEGIGSSSNWQWHDCYATLLNECEVFGGPVFSSSGYDIGIKKAQLPLFTLNPELIVLKNSTDGREWYWFKNVSCGFFFCGYSYSGCPSYGGASSSNSLRLEFLLSA